MAPDEAVDPAVSVHVGDGGGREQHLLAKRLVALAENEVFAEHVAHAVQSAEISLELAAVEEHRLAAHAGDVDGAQHQAHRRGDVGAELQVLHGCADALLAHAHDHAGEHGGVRRAELAHDAAEVIGLDADVGV